MTEPEEKLVLHRGHIFDELLEAVKTREINFKSVKIELILPNGTPESAEDMGGVFRDALSEFWDTFYETCTEGTGYKIPFIRHDFGEREWKGISKILVEGYQRERYFPLKLAPSFILRCLEKEINKDELMLEFLDYISETDRDVINTALNDFESVDFDDLLTLCSGYRSKCLPTKANLKNLIQQIAEQEMIQKPAFVIQCFEAELQKIFQDKNIKKIYEDLKPTVKNILASFDVKKELSDIDATALGYLIKFIKETDEKTRSNFLRFCTGSNLVTEKIRINFIDTSGIARMPIGHTCSNLLELLNTYKNYVEFRSEFNSLFIASVWVMDII